MRFTLPSPVLREEIMENIITEETGTGAVTTTAEPGSEEEQKLAEEIARLWEVHAQASSTLEVTTGWQHKVRGLGLDQHAAPILGKPDPAMRVRPTSRRAIAPWRRSDPRGTELGIFRRPRPAHISRRS